jgi:hypothetical protein
MCAVGLQQAELLLIKTLRTCKQKLSNDTIKSVQKTNSLNLATKIIVLEPDDSRKLFARFSEPIYDDLPTD